MLLLTDHGSQFYANESAVKKRGVTQFENELISLGIRHLLARVDHPQTNGKLERFHGELQRKLHRFGGDVGALVHWWNHIKPHRSLDWDSLETPARAFVRKMPVAGTTVTDSQTGGIRCRLRVEMISGSDMPPSLQKMLKTCVLYPLYELHFAGRSSVKH